MPRKPLMLPAERPASGVPTRRDFLKVGGAAGLGLTLGASGGSALASGDRERAVILLMLVGGPSQLETWDPKPDAPAEIRGPFASIATRIPGVRVCEHLPRLARRLDRVALIRSMHHDAAPIHETGHQLVQTGRLFRCGEEAPHVGSVVAQLAGAHAGAPPFVTLPGRLGNTGVSISHGQSAGILGPAYDPFRVDSESAFTDAVDDPTNATPDRADWYARALVRRAVDLRNEPDSVREAYGDSRFGRSCHAARRLVESGVRFVTVNMYETVFNCVSWDCHGSGPFSTLADYQHRILPEFDRAFSALLDDLDRTGRLDSTLVVATGEFGRTPKLNAAGGRDHWPSVWSAVLAGGGVAGGTVIGASDAHAAEPAERPVSLADLVATMYRSLRIDPRRTMTTADGRAVALLEEGAPIVDALA